MNYEIKQRKSISAELKQFCHLSKEHDFIEITEWTNVEGYDITIAEKNFSVTFGELDAINTLIGIMRAS